LPGGGGGGGVPGGGDRGGAGPPGAVAVALGCTMGAALIAWSLGFLNCTYRSHTKSNETRMPFVGRAGGSAGSLKWAKLQ